MPQKEEEHTEKPFSIKDIFCCWAKSGLLAKKMAKKILTELPLELCESIADELEDVKTLCRFRQTCRAFRYLGAPSNLKHASPIPYAFVHANYVDRRSSQTLFLPKRGVRTSGPAQRASLTRRLAFPQNPPPTRVFFGSLNAYVAEDRFPPWPEKLGSVGFITDCVPASLAVFLARAHLRARIPKRFSLLQWRSNDEAIVWPSDCVLVLCVFQDANGPKQARKAVPDRFLHQIYSGPRIPIEVIITGSLLLSRWLEDGRMFASDLTWERERAKDVRGVLATRGVTGLDTDFTHRLVHGTTASDLNEMRPAIQTLPLVPTKPVVSSSEAPMEEIRAAQDLYDSARRSVCESNRGATMFVVTPFEKDKIPSVKDFESHGLATASTKRWQYVAVCKHHQCWWGNCNKTAWDIEDEAHYGITDCVREKHPSKIKILVVFSPDRASIPTDPNALREALQRENLNGTRDDPAEYESCRRRDEPDWD